MDFFIALLSRASSPIRAQSVTQRWRVECLEVVQWIREKCRGKAMDITPRVNKDTPLMGAGRWEALIWPQSFVMRCGAGLTHRVSIFDERMLRVSLPGEAM